MNKWGIGVSAAIAALLAGGALTSYVMGGKVQSGLEATAQEWSKPPLTVQVQRYERGLFSSTAQTLWTLNTGEEILTFTADHAISHGPWPRGHAAEIDTHFAISPDAPPELVSLYKDQSPLAWKTTIGWTQSSHHSLTSPAVEGRFDKEQISFAGLTADFDMTADLKGMKGTATMPRLQIASTGPAEADEEGGDSGPAKMLLQGNAMRFDLLQPQGQEFMVGSVNWTLDTLTTEPKIGGDPVQMNGLSMNIDTKHEGEVVNTGISTAVKLVTLPGQKINDIAVDVALRNLDAAWLNQFTKGSQQAQGNPQALQALLLGGMQQLLARKPALEIQRIAWHTDEGASEIAAAVSYQGNASKPLNPATDLKAYAKLNMPKPVLQKLLGSKVRDALIADNEGDEDYAPEQLASMVQDDVKARINALQQSGILIEANNQFTANLEYQQGQLRANGKALDGQGMMGALGAIP